MDKLEGIRAVSFDWNDRMISSGLPATGGRQIGLVAQEVEKVFPELVDSSMQFKGVNYERLTAVLLQAVKEQQEQIKRLQRELDDLKSENRELGRRMEMLEAPVYR